MYKCYTLASYMTNISITLISAIRCIGYTHECYITRKYSLYRGYHTPTSLPIGIAYLYSW